MATYGDISLERMVRAVERVRKRLLRATAALEKADIPYAVAGGNAIAAWVSRVDEAAVRNTQDVDIVLLREDLERAKLALSAIGFVYRESFGVDMFLDGPDARPRDVVHVIFAGEKGQPDYMSATPTVDEAELGQAFRVLNLDALVRMKLTSYRDKHRTHLRDLIDVGLIDATWPARFDAELGERLQHLLDTPGG